MERQKWPPQLPKNPNLKPPRLEVTTQNPNPPRSDQINSTNHQKFQIKKLNPWTKINWVAWFVKFLPIHGWSTPICWICTRDQQTHGIRNHLTQGPVICNIDRTKSLMQQLHQITRSRPPRMGCLRSQLISRTSSPLREPPPHQIEDGTAIPLSYSAGQIIKSCTGLPKHANRIWEGESN